MADAPNGDKTGYPSANQATCWLCGDVANSKEHIFKAQLIKAYFDRNGSSLDRRPLHIFGSHNKIDGMFGQLVENSNCPSLKYDRSICIPCNNVRTKLFDQAYDNMSNWFSKSQDGDGVASLDLSELYGDGWRDSVENFRRYCAKALGCRIIASGYGLAPSFPNPLTGANMERLCISICRTQPFRAIERFGRCYEPWMQNEILSKGELYGLVSQHQIDSLGRHEVSGAVWWENIGKFQVNFWLDVAAPSEMGVPFDGSNALYQFPASGLDLIEMADAMWAWFC